MTGHLIRRSPFSDRVYLITRWRVEGDAIVATRKSDITDEYENMRAEDSRKRRKLRGKR